ncbi:DoxX family protein [Brevibacillus migulae]|uniref:DoxX family protein n=1 Tax=Brevibacillus migulae TaxID=1644114 RepID=UPI00106EBB29|nr:DoxX family protein [Brevibacillus migulae]
MSKKLIHTLIRVGFGVIFMVHGIAKLQMGLDNVAGFFGSLGLPGFLGYVVAYLELIGGIAVILGVGTRVFAVLFALLMAGATLKVKLSGGLLGNGQGAGYELDLALLLIALHLIISDQSYALSNLWSKKESTRNILS